MNSLHLRWPLAPRRRALWRRLGAASALALTPTVASCGALVSTSAIADADAAVERALDAGADRFAVYEIVSAVEYLAKAREEWGRSDFQHAASYADHAAEMADAALERALVAPNRPTVVDPASGR